MRTTGVRNSSGQCFKRGIRGRSLELRVSNGRGLCFLELVAKLFGALASWARRIKREVGVEVCEERGIVLLFEVNVREQTIDDGNVWSELAGLLGGGQRVGEVILLEEGTTKFVVTQPKMGIQLEATANALFGFDSVAAVEQDSAEADGGFGVGVLALLEGVAEGFFRFRAVAERLLGHAELVGSLVVGWRQGNSLLQIGESGLCIFIVVELLHA